MKIEIDTDDFVVRVDGAPISFDVLDALVHPDPRKWLRFERQADGQIFVYGYTPSGPDVAPPMVRE